MAETVNDKKVFTLLDVTASIRKTLAERYTSVFWVKAEINKLNHYPHSGHCYPDLVEKREGKVIAQLRSTLWREDFERVNRDFLRIVKSPLKDGIQVLICARVAFDAMHGLSLRIVDIDPGFSLGELEREKQETIALLTEEGIFHRNKQITLAALPRRVAVISVQTSKGYADFLKVIDANPWGYKIFHMLFPSVLQGDRAVDTIVYQLSQIKKVAHHFDAVAIIRGGGGEVGLSCFNHYQLARDIATFPLPILSGIGHATNETVAEMIAWRNSITPTDLANFLIERHRQFDLALDHASQTVVHSAQQQLMAEQHRFHAAAKAIRVLAHGMLVSNKHQLEANRKALKEGARRAMDNGRQEQQELRHRFRKSASTITAQHHQTLALIASALRKDVKITISNHIHAVATLANIVDNLNPIHVLRRGYSLTLHNGTVIKDAAQLNVGDIIETQFASGAISSEVKQKMQKQTNNE